MAETVLVINAGSSSIKFQLFDIAHDPLRLRIKGQIEGIGARPRLLANNAAGKILIDQTWPPADVESAPEALDKVVVFLRAQIGGNLPSAIGHRIVHGGPELS